MTLMIKTLLAGTALLTAPAAAQSVAQDADNQKIVVTAQNRVPTEAFGRRPFMQNPRISPDGRRMAVKMANKGKEFLALVDLDAVGAKPQFIMANDEQRDVGDRSVSTWRFVGNDHVVITLSSRENIFGQRYDVRRLISYDIKSKKSTPLAWEMAGGQAADIKHIDHDKGVILLQRQNSANGSERMQLPEIVSVNVATGKMDTVMRTNPIVENWLVDGSGVVRAGQGGDRDSGKERLMYRSNAKGQMQTVSNVADTTFTGANIVPQVFLDEPDMAVALSNKDNFRRVYKVNVKTMEVGPVMFERPGYDVEEQLHVNDAGNKLLGVRVVEEGIRDHWFDPDWKIIQGLMDEQFGRGNAQVVSRDRKDERLIFYVGKPSQPGGYYLYDTKTGKLSLIGWLHPTIKDGTLNSMSTVTYTARDGLKIPAVVTMPRHRAGQKNLPVVVLPHGGPFGVRQHEEFGFFPWHQMLAEAGYVVIEPNYRGSGGYGKEFVLKGRAKDGYGMKMQDDLNDAVAWFAKAGTIDAKRACVMGWSYGGYAAARGAQRDGDLWRCAIAGAGVYDFPMMKKFDQQTFGSFGANFQATVDDLNGISSARNTGGKWAPILIVAGVRDARIPIEQSRTLVSRLKGSGKKEGVDFRYIEQPQGTHNLPYEDVHTQWLTETEAWLAKHNPAYIASDPDKPKPVATAMK